MKIAGSGAGSVSQRYGSADPDPDPYQNVTDPQHCLDRIRDEESLPRPTSLKVSLKSLNFWLESALIGEV
jgi:hypothetical protein